VNQAPITGESLPVLKGPGSEVFAGLSTAMARWNLSPRRSPDTTLSHIIHMVSEAQSRRAPSERWVEKFARVYTPSVMGLAIAVAVVPPLVFEGSWGRWFYQALVLLVIAALARWSFPRR